MTDPHAITAAIAAIEPGVDLDRIADALGKMRALRDWVKQLDGELTAAIIEHIKATDKFTIGDTEYSYGRTATTKCESSAETFEALMGVMSIEDIKTCLASDAFKPGETRKRLEELGQAGTFNELFVTKFSDVLKLKTVNTKFIHGPAVRKG